MAVLSVFTETLWAIEQDFPITPKADHMERRNRRDEEKNSHGGLGPDDDKGVRLAAEVRRILDVGTIPQRELDEDRFLGEVSVEEHLRRRRGEL